MLSETFQVANIIENVTPILLTASSEGTSHRIENY